jgi:signal transduction histidine kinase
VSASNKSVVDVILDSMKFISRPVENILSNAIKYSPQQNSVEFYFTQEPNYLIFQISDRGIGIPEEDLEDLFSAFHRGKNVGILPGTGLGLSIVKNCIDIHNGTIAVNSKLNVGTEFTVTLPIESKN